MVIDIALRGTAIREQKDPMISLLEVLKERGYMTRYNQTKEDYGLEVSDMNDRTRFVKFFETKL